MKLPDSFQMVKHPPKDKPFGDVLLHIKGDYQFEIGHYCPDSKLWHVNKGPSEWATFKDKDLSCWYSLPQLF
jgi:hypothetical protein